MHHVVKIQRVFGVVFFYGMVKKVTFGLSVIIAVGLFIRIMNILIFDYSRLTQYGFGYFAGQLILFLLFLVLSIMLAKKVFKRQG